MLAAVVLIVATACTGQQQTPKGYGDTTSKNFQKGCVAASKERIDNPVEVCGCAYKAVTAKIPFKDFKKVYSDLRDDPGPLPERFSAIMSDCVDQESTPG